MLQVYKLMLSIQSMKELIKQNIIGQTCTIRAEYIHFISGMAFWNVNTDGVIKAYFNLKDILDEKLYNYYMKISFL